MNYYLPMNASQKKATSAITQDSAKRTPTTPPTEPPPKAMDTQQEKQDWNLNDPMVLVGAVDTPNGITIPNKAHGTSDAVHPAMSNQPVTSDQGTNDTSAVDDMVGS